MATVEERYTAATAYVRRAIAVVEDRPLSYLFNPVTGTIEGYAGRTKTATARSDLARIEARWMRATSDAERAQVSRDAELLADRVQENLPGAPQDRQRTNLFPGEKQASTPATSYGDELADQAAETLKLGRGILGDAADGLATVGKWLLLGGGVLLSLKTVDYLRERERRQSAGSEQRTLNANLARVANQRNAGTRRRTYSIRLPWSEIEALYFLRGRYDSAKAFVDGLIPLDESADRALSGEYDRNQGPYRFQIRAADVRKVLRATRLDGGDFGAIPNLRSDSVDFVLGEEARHAT